MFHKIAPSSQGNPTVRITPSTTVKMLMTRTYIESLFSYCPLLDKFKVETNITCDDEEKHVWTLREDRHPLLTQGWCGEELC
jgi:hypothetical protein